MDKEFMAGLLAGKDTECPCCGRYAKVYRRTLHTSVALQLITLFKKGGHRKYIHVSELIPPGTSGSGDFTKAKYWGLIEEQEHVADKTKKSGYWALSDKGVAFVRGNWNIPKYALVYDDRVLGFDGEEITIRACLGNEFNYSQLMAA